MALKAKDFKQNPWSLSPMKKHHTLKRRNLLTSKTLRCFITNKNWHSRFYNQRCHDKNQTNMHKLHLQFSLSTFTHHSPTSNEAQISSTHIISSIPITCSTRILHHLHPPQCLKATPIWWLTRSIQEIKRL